MSKGETGFIFEPRFVSASPATGRPDTARNDARGTASFVRAGGLPGVGRGIRPGRPAGAGRESMRRTLNWYIFRQLLLATLFVTLALTCAIWLTQSLHFVKLIINRGMTLGSFLQLTLLLLPTFLLIIMPIALFHAVLFSYHKMVSDREMVIM